MSKSQRHQIRQIMEKVLPSSTELDAFIIDHWPRVARSISLAMEATAKINYLFLKVDPLSVYKLLLTVYPSATQTAAREISVDFTINESAQGKPRHSFESARKLAIYSVLAVIGITTAFFVLAPALGFPMEYHHSLRILEVIIPVFLGYLGSASYSLFKNFLVIPDMKISNLSIILLKGTILMFCIIVAIGLLSYGISNRAHAPLGSGMSPDELSALITMALGLLTASTNVVISYLFASYADNES